MRTLILIFLLSIAAYADEWNFSITPTSSTDIDYVDDAFIDNSEATTNYGTGQQLYFGSNYDERWVWVAFWAISDSLELEAYDGSDGDPNYSGVDSAKIVFEISGVPDENDTLSGYLFAIKRDPVESEITWNIYSTGNSWETAGAQGSNDRYTSRESDGTHVDSIIVTGDDSQHNTYNCWINPDHIAEENWLLELSYEVGAEPNACYFYASDAWGTTGPKIYIYGGGSGATEETDMRRRRTMILHGGK